MSLDHLEAKLTDIRAEAERVQHQWNQTTAAVQNDGTLSDMGKREKLDDARTAARDRMRGLREKETSLVATKKQALERSLFGISDSDPNNIIAYRDARDRAGRLASESDAKQLLASAKLSGDLSLAQAILAQAINNNWADIVNDYTNENPAAGRDLKDLNMIRRYEQQGTGFTYLIM